MADIELIIKIPEDIYKDIMTHNRESREGGKSAYYFEGLIQNGTLLSEGHGRIIDENKITRCQQVGLIMKDGNITRCFVTDAPTIISRQGRKRG